MSPTALTERRQRTRPKHFTNWASPNHSADLHSLHVLIEELQAEGVTIEHADRLIDLRRNFDRFAPEVQVPGIDVLTATDDELTQLVAEDAARRAAHAAVQETRMHMLDDARRAMAKVMAAAADSYLDVLRPKFDEAADAARKVRDLGVEPNDTAEQVIARGAEAAAAWLAFKQGGQMQTMIRIAHLRAGIARILDIGEGGRHGREGGRPNVDHSVGITRPYQPGLLGNETDVATWLAAAPHLHLVPFTGMDAGDLKRANARHVIRPLTTD